MILRSGTIFTVPRSAFSHGLALTLADYHVKWLFFEANHIRFIRGDRALLVREYFRQTLDLAYYII